MLSTPSPENIKCSYYLFPLKLLLFSDVNSVTFSSLDKECVKSRLQDCAYWPFKQVLKISDKNLLDEELKALKNLFENMDLVIQKADRGNTIVILNKDDCVSRLNPVLDGTSKFQKVRVEEGKALNNIILMEGRIIDILKNFENQNEIKEKNYDNVYPSSSKRGILYGLGKIHKALADRIPSFRPIVSGIGTPIYKLAKFWDKLLKPIATNEYTIKHSFSFGKKVEEFNHNLVMANFDVKSLFTKIPFTETIVLCVENLYRNGTHIYIFFYISIYTLNKKIYNHQP